MEVEVLKFYPSKGEGKSLGYGRLKLFGSLECSYALYDGRNGLWVKCGKSFKGKDEKWRNDIYIHKGPLDSAILEAVLKEYGQGVPTGDAWPDKVEIDKGTHFTSEDIPF